MYSTAQYRNIQYNALILSAIQFDSTGQDRTGQERTVRDNFETIQHDTSQYMQYITRHQNEEKIQYPIQSSSIQFGALFYCSFILLSTIIVNF
jgi:hypothetical protein